MGDPSEVTNCPAGSRPCVLELGLHRGPGAHRWPRNAASAGHAGGLPGPGPQKPRPERQRQKSRRLRQGGCKAAASTASRAFRARLRFYIF